MSTHALAPDLDGDESCVDCGVTLSQAAKPTFLLTCPTSECRAPSNPDGACVFARKADVSLCVYCGRLGGVVPQDDTELEDLPA